MSAVVLGFSREWQGRFEPSSIQLSEQQKALRQARLIKEAKGENSDWTASLLISLLAVMDKAQLSKLELALCTQADNEEAQQALALVRFANGGSTYRQRVQGAVDALQGSAL